MIEDIFRKIDLKKSKLAKLKPIDPQFKRKLDDKYRLEWNFHSNHIEGNTLTYGQTKILLFKGRATGEHSKRDYDEMEAHDLAIELIKEWASDSERDMRENDLRQLNKIILVRPFWNNATTEDGSPTRKKIIPGEYKSTPNSVRLKNGAIHHYPSPDETRVLMPELFDWYKNNTDMHPLLLAAYAHHKLTNIHPFDDGNGRVARLWLNYILLRNDYPPIVIRTENKEEYLSSLEKADAGDIEPFIEYLAKELDWSLDLSVRAAKGKELEEPDDLDKQIAIMDKRIKGESGKEEKEVVKKSFEMVMVFKENSLVPLFELIKKDFEKVRDWFVHIETNIAVDNKLYDDFLTLEIDLLKQELKNDPAVIRFDITLEGFKTKGADAFNVFCSLAFRLNKWSIEIVLNNREEILKKIYGQELSDEESKMISRKMLQYVVSEINKSM